MIKTATDEDLKRIADKMFETQRKDFQNKLDAQSVAVEALSSRLRMFEDAQTEASRIAGSSHQAAMICITQLDLDLTHVSTRVNALDVRIRQCVSDIEMAQGRLAAAEERMYSKLTDVLNAFARMENRHGK
jgi:chaperonin cofactor prefoldin